jgi:putative ABC transport system substrate-binding protein
MRRRDVSALLLGAIAAWPVQAIAQKAGKIWRMGFLAHGHEIFYEPLFKALHELGYDEGQNLVVERRYAEGRADRFQALAEEIVRLNPDVVIVVTTPAALAMKKATSTIPVVFPNAINPLETGVVASLANPGGNVTGGAIPTAELSAKRLEILKQAMPSLSVAAVLWNAANPSVSLGWRDTQKAARDLGVVVEPYQVREPKDFEPAFSALANHRPDVLVVFQDALTLQHRREIIDFTIRERLPAMFTAKEWAEEGGLVSYGENLGEMYRRAAYHVDKILHGTKPADLPVEQPTKFDLAVNVKTAKAIGFAVPDALLDRADVIFE